MAELKEAILFEYERISDTIMEFGFGATLKMVVDIGLKDKDNHKKRIYEEFRYRNTTKYNNTDYLISASRNANFYLKIEFPSNGEYKKGNILLPSYSIMGLKNIVNKFDSILFNPYRVSRNGEVDIIEKDIIKMVSKPTPTSKIEIEHSVFQDRDGRNDYGVNIGFNEDFYLTIRSVTTWKSFVYYINTCDLYTWGTALLAPYTANLMGKAVSEMGDYKSTARYDTERIFKADPDDIATAEMLNNSKPVNSKPVTREGRIKSFFD